MSFAEFADIKDTWYEAEIAFSLLLPVAIFSFDFLLAFSSFN